MQGYIQLHRKLQKWEWYTDANTFRLFIHLLLNTNHDYNRWHGVDIQRGQLITGRKELAKALNLSEQQIRTSLDKLIKTSEITSKPTNKYSLITVTQYDSYQYIKTFPTSKHANKQPTSNQQVTTNNNVNNDNNVNNKDICPEQIAQDKIVISLPTNKFNTENQEYQVSKTQCSLWEEVYPAVDVDQTLKRIKSWLVSNPKKRKTISGMSKFIDTWLSKQQDKGANNAKTFNNGQYKQNQDGDILGRNDLDW